MPVEVTFVPPADLRDILRGMAVVSLLREQRVHMRDHEFRLDPVTNIATARWGDPAGNRAHFLFTSSGCVILGFDHESPMSPHATATGPDDFRAFPGVYDSLPGGLMELIVTNPFQPEWDMREVTFCLWNLGNSRTWMKGDINYPEDESGEPDGQGFILRSLLNYVDDFAGWFGEFFKWELDEAAVTELLSGDEITRDCLRRLNPATDIEAAVPQLEAMGFRVV